MLGHTDADAPSLAGMVLIPEGTFEMGCDWGTDPYLCTVEESPLHTVQLDADYIDKHEVTNSRYAACVDAGVCSAPKRTSSPTWPSYYGDPAYANYPVIYVDWLQAGAFCEWEHKRLPTEAEWEKAARGASDRRAFPWGNDTPPCGRANGPTGCVGDTTAVGSYSAGASPYGVMDMAGNVLEWVNDWYDPDYYTYTPYSNPPGPATGAERVTRGGSYSSLADWFVRNASREHDAPSSPFESYAENGFRCAYSVQPAGHEGDVHVVATLGSPAPGYDGDPSCIIPPGDCWAPIQTVTQWVDPRPVTCPPGHLPDPYTFWYQNGQANVDTGLMAGQSVEAFGICFEDAAGGPLRDPDPAGRPVLPARPLALEVACSTGLRG